MVDMRTVPFVTAAAAVAVSEIMSELLVSYLPTHIPARAVLPKVKAGCVAQPPTVVPL